LDVQLVVMRGADKAVQALVGGSVYVAASGADASIAAVEHGLDLVIVGGAINGLTHMIMGAKNVRGYDDLRGATIATPSASVTSGTALVMRRMLKAKGLEFPRDYQILGAGGSGPAFTALTSSQIPAAFVAIPLSFAAADMGYNIVGRAVDVIPGYQLAALAVHRSWAMKNRPLFIRFLRGVVLGARWLRENKQPAIDFLVKEMDLKPEHARRGWEYYVENRIWDPNADVTIDGVKAALQIYAEQAQMKGPLPGYSKYVDQSYLKDAVKELGR
jgi:ABC-type nitrate/sulfonate/bicarbonate transport system substrate-binding protein